VNEIYLQMKEVGRKVDKFIVELVDGEGRPEVLYRAAKHIINAGGKRLRPYLVCKTCSLVGGRVDDAIPAAASIEILHTFTMIHDDIMDQDSIRRGVETVHKKWGVPIAIMAGDLLFAEVFKILYVVNNSEVYSPDVRLNILRFLVEATIRICEGQALDMEFEHIEEVKERDYLEMISRKTASLLEASTKVGGLIGGATKDQLNKLGEFGWNAGMAFQIIDDVLGLTADERELGKPVGSDIREGKKTIIIIHALQYASEVERRKILKSLGDKEAPQESISELIEILKSLGSIKYAMDKASEYASKAKNALRIFDESPDREDLLRIVDLIVTRRR